MQQQPDEVPRADGGAAPASRKNVPVFKKCSICACNRWCVGYCGPCNALRTQLKGTGAVAALRHAHQRLGKESSRQDILQRARQFQQKEKERVQGL